MKLVESYTQLPENPLPHWELARKYDIIDFDLGVKLTGEGFSNTKPGIIGYLDWKYCGWVLFLKIRKQSFIIFS